MGIGNVEYYRHWSSDSRGFSWNIYGNQQTGNKCGGRRCEHIDGGISPDIDTGVINLPKEKNPKRPFCKGEEVKGIIPTIDLPYLDVIGHCDKCGRLIAWSKQDVVPSLQ